MRKLLLEFFVPLLVIAFAFGAGFGVRAMTEPKPPAPIIHVSTQEIQVISHPITIAPVSYCHVTGTLVDPAVTMQLDERFTCSPKPEPGVVYPP